MLGLGFALIAFDQGEPGTVVKDPEPVSQSSYDSWRDKCAALPTNRELDLEFPPRSLLALTAPAFERSIVETMDLYAKTLDQQKWVGSDPDKSFYNKEVGYFRDEGVSFQAYAQKLNLSAGSRVCFQGDLHGDIHSLLRVLDWLNEKEHLDGFKIVEPDFHMVFLGDYTDRGAYGAEVIHTLVRLKTHNPENVWLVRGNHEDLALIRKYGFADELRHKFGVKLDLFNVTRFYDFLPVVLYVGSGTDYLQCNHGGMEPGYDPGTLLSCDEDRAAEVIRELRQVDFFRSHLRLVKDLPVEWTGELANFSPASPSWPVPTGFMWNDFAILNNEPELFYIEDRGWIYGKGATQVMLQEYSGESALLRGVFRAHQHSKRLDPMMRRLIATRGIFRHWQDGDSRQLLDAPNEQLEAALEIEETRSLRDGGVYTFNVSPDSVYGVRCGYDFATIGILTTAKSFEDWTLQCVSIPVAP